MFNQRLLYAVLTSTFFLLFCIIAPAQSEDRSKTIKDIDSIRKQIAEKEKLFLSPSAEDLAACAEFLKQPKTGLIRLLPKGLYKDILLLPGGGASYSFARLTYEDGYHSDLEIQKAPKNDYGVSRLLDHNFLSGFVNSSYGLLTVLGDIPLEKVTLDHVGVKFLLTYDPPSTALEASKEKRRAIDGIVKDGYIYRLKASVIPNSTYLLRSIDFDQSDVLMAFRVVRREVDGSVVILWKMLKRFSRPGLVRTGSR
jgi:hypothetical protein